MAPHIFGVVSVLFFSDVSLGALAYFLIGLFAFLAFKCSFHILGNSLLSDVFCKYCLSVGGLSSHSLDDP